MCLLPPFESKDKYQIQIIKFGSNYIVGSKIILCWEIQPSQRNVVLIILFFLFRLKEGSQVPFLLMGPGRKEVSERQVLFPLLEG